MGIKLVVDSSSEITQEESKEMGVYCLPLTVSFEEDMFRDGVDLSYDEFYDKLSEYESLPKTSQVTPYLYEEAFKEILSNGDIPVAITLSSEISGTYNSAILASNQFEEEIHIIDSLTTSCALKLIIKYALSIIDKYDDPVEFVNEIEKIKKKAKIFYLLDTLEYLYKGGRLSKFSALAGSILSIKPIISFDDSGKVVMLSKSRGWKKGISLLSDLVKESGEIDEKLGVILSYSGKDSSIVDSLKQKSESLFSLDVNAIPVTQIGCTIGTHAGPGTIGISYFTK
ncbi:DegV family protein [Peptostreptococcus porci]|uniref:DegV family protein n=1 Tax=Peptostreptococcus porci TaxID=2652282 RepID=UPI002A908620|nr:DegV family protein [Peptostreptococcus porci]MDY5436099.1 DegV family protein [Peptostreptococcus porci]MDY6230991.1 DegV family protein [Peptostreptococcus porci]